MVIYESHSGEALSAEMSQVTYKDFGQITKKRYFFDWKALRGIAEMFKLTIEGKNDILGLVAIMDYPNEYRIQMLLLCASRENIGKHKKYNGIVGNLIAYVGQIAIRKYRDLACISLIPKTELRAHYKATYKMIDGGPQLFLEGAALNTFIKKYHI